MDELFHLLGSGCRFPLGSPFRFSQRLLYVVNHCYPFSSNGYAVRTHAVARALVDQGLEVIVASRPGLPWDRKEVSGEYFTVEHQIDGVRYLHTPKPSQVGLTPEEYVAQSAEVYVELIRIFKPIAVMAASNWRNALPAALAANDTGRLFYYEVRGFWEITRIASEPDWQQTDDFREEVQNEVAVARAAEQLFTLNSFMCDELVRRGVKRARIDLVPNGFPGWVECEGSNADLKKKLGIQSRYIVGYIGSFNGYEGLEDLIEAAASVRRNGVDLSILLVGSSESMGIGAGGTLKCSASERYRSLASNLGFESFLILPGRVAPEQIDDYYELLDLFVIPRKPCDVCEIVSPMKPLEAVAHGKHVLMSDVNALADIGDICSLFSLFKKGDIKSLAAALEKHFTSPKGEETICYDGLDAFTWDKNVLPMVKAFSAASIKCSS